MKKKLNWQHLIKKSKRSERRSENDKSKCCVDYFQVKFLSSRVCSRGKINIIFNDSFLWSGKKVETWVNFSIFSHTVWKPRNRKQKMRMKKLFKFAARNGINFSSWEKIQLVGLAVKWSGGNFNFMRRDYSSFFRLPCVDWHWKIARDKKENCFLFPLSERKSHIFVCVGWRNGTSSS